METENGNLTKKCNSKCDLSEMETSIFQDFESVGQVRSLTATCGRDYRDDRRSNKLSLEVTKLSDDQQS